MDRPRSGLGENAADLIGTLVPMEFGRPRDVREVVLRQRILPNLSATGLSAARSCGSATPEKVITNCSS